MGEREHGLKGEEEMGQACCGLWRQLKPLDRQTILEARCCTEEAVYFCSNSSMSWVTHSDLLKGGLKGQIVPSPVYSALLLLAHCPVSFLLLLKEHSDERDFGEEKIYSAYNPRLWSNHCGEAKAGSSVSPSASTIKSRGH